MFCKEKFSKLSFLDDHCDINHVYEIDELCKAEISRVSIKEVSFVPSEMAGCEDLRNDEENLSVSEISLEEMDDTTAGGVSEDLVHVAVVFDVFDQFYHGDLGIGMTWDETVASVSGGVTLPNAGLNDTINENSVLSVSAEEDVQDNNDENFEESLAPVEIIKSEVSVDDVDNENFDKVVIVDGDL
jgi:hypothetical protein